MSEPTTEARLTEAHPIWAGGPDCDEQCPGKWSQYHDGFAWGYEKAQRDERARIRREVDELWHTQDCPALLDEAARCLCHRAAVLRIIDGSEA